MAGDAITVSPGRPAATSLCVPGDPSSAAFLVVAAALAPGSDLALENVGLWPRRTGFLQALQRAGACIQVAASAETGADPVGSLRVQSGPLDAFEIQAQDVPDLVDEVPVLALAAARAHGTSRFSGLSELRVKESDRIAGVARLLGACGVPVTVSGDALEITGVTEFSAPPPRGHDDHRLALTAAVARHLHGCAGLPDEPSAAVSWPGFSSTLARLAATDAS